MPLFSALKCKGKRLFEWAHLGVMDVPRPTKEGEIYAIRLDHLHHISLRTLIEKTILPNLAGIIGHFRQEKIIVQWENFLEDLSEDIQVSVARIYVETSRGIYVRALSQDICAQIGFPGFVTHLERVSNGPYKRKHCVTLEQVFGERYDKDLFVFDKGGFRYPAK